MKHIWSILCEKSSIDFENNRLSIFDCLETIKFVVDKTKTLENKKIAIPLNFQIISFWTIKNPNKENSLDIKIEIIDPNGKILNVSQNNFKVKKDIKRFRNRNNIQGMPVTESGRYYFKIWQKTDSEFELVSELPLDIDISYEFAKKLK